MEYIGYRFGAVVVAEPQGTWGTPVGAAAEWKAAAQPEVMAWGVSPGSGQAAWGPATQPEAAAWGPPPQSGSVSWGPPEDD